MKYLISGGNGFIGSALKNGLCKVGATEANSPKEADFYFYFGSPSSQILFNENRSDCIQDTIRKYLDVCELCRLNHIKLIYPSSATVYEAENSYAYTKKALEAIQKAYDFPILGLRIFAGYGVGENRKKYYSSVVNQWIDVMMNGERPVVYGDGNQSRDFVYVTDIVDTILSNLYTTGIIDVGTGVNTTFNDVVSLINQELRTNLSPIYVGKPDKYLETTSCDTPMKNSISINQGISMMIRDKNA